MAGLKLGSVTPSAIYLGASAVSKIYLGATEVWPLASGATLTADAGTFTLTGVNASFLRALRMQAAAGSFALTGNDAGLFTGNPDLIAETGTFTLTGNAAALTRALVMAASSGSFSLTGNDAALSKTFTLLASSGSFTLTGVNASFARALVMSAVKATFTLTGNNATLTYSSTDPNFSSVVLLCGFDGVDGATSSTDDSNAAHTLTFAGGAEIDTAQSKFGGSSLALDGSGDRVSCAASTDWNFGSSSFTIEMFVRFNTITSANRSALGSGGTSTVSFLLGVNSGLSDFQFAFSTNGGSSFNQIITSSGVTATTGVWYHLCVDRDGSNKFRLYVDGVMRGSLTTASAVNYESTALAIGATNDAGDSDMNGWIDEVRITKGVARYASDSGFTVPTAAYPRS